MKILRSLAVILSSIIISTDAFAVYFDIIGPCSPKPLKQGSFVTDITDNVGNITTDIFDMFDIPYSGSADGISMILNSPIGLDAMEVISDTKMRAYGWCFSINGVVPETLASQTYFIAQNDYLSWFYAYSTYDRGVWSEYCTPSHKIKSKQFCK